MNEWASNASSDYVIIERVANISRAHRASKYNASNSACAYAPMESPPLPNAWKHFWIYMIGATLASAMAITHSIQHGYYIFTACFAGWLTALWAAAIHDWRKYRKILHKGGDA